MELSNTFFLSSTIDFLQRINGSPTLIMIVEVLKTKFHQESTSIFLTLDANCLDLGISIWLWGGCNGMALGFFMGAHDACMSHENIIHIACESFYSWMMLSVLHISMLANCDISKCEYSISCFEANFHFVNLQDYAWNLVLKVFNKYCIINFLIRSYFPSTLLVN